MSYGTSEYHVPLRLVESMCYLFAQLSLRGISVIFTSGDNDGVGKGDRKDQYAMSTSSPTSLHPVRGAFPHDHTHTPLSLVYYARPPLLPFLSSLSHTMDRRHSHSPSKWLEGNCSQAARPRASFSLDLLALDAHLNTTDTLPDILPRSPITSATRPSFLSLPFRFCAHFFSLLLMPSF